MSYFTYKESRLSAENIDLADLVKSISTPFYCYSLSSLQDKYKTLSSSYKNDNLLICYSIKANSNQSIIKCFSDLGSGADVVSIGELKRALKAKIPNKKIVFSGVGKTTEEINYALEKDILMFNVESLDELKHLSVLAKNQGIKAPTAIRINPNIAAGGNAKISTGKTEDKFGINWEDAIDIYNIADSLEGIEIKGIDIHIGSQINDLDPFSKSFECILDIIKELESRNFNIDIIDIGGGIGIDYKDEGKNLNIDEYFELVQEKLGDLGKTIIIEPGRYLTAESGVLVTEIIYVKKESNKNFVIVDAGMNDFIRPTLYGAEHKILPVIENTRSNSLEPYDIVGPICETGDLFLKNLPLNNPKKGDLLALLSVGAYGSVLSSNYNSRPTISEVLVKDHQSELIRDKIEIDEIVKRDKIPDWL